jgi:hypothetical protein
MVMMVFRVKLKDFMQQKNHAFILLLKLLHELEQGVLTIIIITIVAKPDCVCKSEHSTDLQYL